ncbi:MAG: tetratricopeptide repeat protein [Candidatus Omnitrophica bacterium]|nr:tetratricopeptide repeat protein [Candidatus Omnitrophota bacterium]
MYRFIRWFLIAAGIVVIAGVIFTFYARFLVDYSLESLQIAQSISTSETNDRNETPLGGTYQHLMQNLLLEEASREDIDLKELSLLEMAARNKTGINKSDEKMRVDFYLDELQRIKKVDRGFFLQGSDTFYRIGNRMRRSFFTFLRYLKTLVNKPAEESVNVTASILISQAELSEKRGDFEKAVQLYEQYLTKYADTREAGAVSLNLANILIKQKQWADAQKVLKDVSLNFAGGQEGDMALSLFRRVEFLKRKYEDIKNLNQSLEKDIPRKQRDSIIFRLGLNYLSLEQLQEAKMQFEQLRNSASDNQLRQRSKFYLGWIYKLTQDYDTSAQILKELLNDQTIENDMRMALEAQLADVYYQKRDTSASLEYYESLSEEARDRMASDAAQKAWVGLAEMEQSFISVNLGDGVTVSGGAERPSISSAEVLEGADAVIIADTQESAFRRLQEGEVAQAMNLFEKNLKKYPDDAVSHAGMAVSYVLMTDLKNAEASGRKAYQLKKSEYTASVLAYVTSYMGDKDRAIQLYQEALSLQPEYSVARFNIAVLFLQKKNYEAALRQLKVLDKKFEGAKSRTRSKVLNNMGYALWWIGHYDESVERFKQALEITPDFSDAAENLEKVNAGYKPRQPTVQQAVNAQG